MLTVTVIVHMHAVSTQKIYVQLSSSGNDALHALTSSNNYRLVVDITYRSGGDFQAVYDTFSVAGPNDFYRVTAYGYTGNSGKFDAQVLA